MKLEPKTIKEWLIGKPRDINDPRVFHNVSLVAFLAWVGLGADGLSSSSYGPEEAFKALEDHRHLALLLALATAATVVIISACYRQVIQRFPTGGGGYLVASKLLGTSAGAVSGAALTVDYVLTIAVSVASGCDAIWSFFPLAWQLAKFPAELAVVMGLILLNLRGVKESVTTLLPIFLIFLITHLVLILYGVIDHAGPLTTMVIETPTRIGADMKALGTFAVVGIFLRAYSLGGGTYTGIEAVSNAIPIMREPRAQTAQRTMLMMAISLAFTAGGIITCYLLADVHHVEGSTMNAVLARRLFGDWNLWGLRIGMPLALITILSEGVLLFVAAQTGFLGGPRVLANMAFDSWVPHRFAQLSERLVTMNGVWLMGLSAIAVLLYSHGRVHVLVVMYSINVFLTFSLSMLGMCRYWLDQHRLRLSWKRGFALNTVGLVLCASVLVITTVEKFTLGGWMTVLVTSSVVAFCFLIRRHYRQVRENLTRLDAVLTEIPLPDKPIPNQHMDKRDQTAVIIVKDFDGLGMHSLLSVARIFPGVFRNFIFLSVGVVDSGNFKGTDELDSLQAHTRESLEKYVDWARRAGMKADYRMAVGTEVIEALTPLCREVAHEFPRSVFFAGKLIFQDDRPYYRMLHNETPAAIQRALGFAGLQTVILPIRVG
jgi:amino acid transporter